MRRLILPALVTCAALALLTLLAFGVAGQGDSSSIDAAVAKGHFPAAPSAHTALPVLGSDARASLASLRGRFVLLNVFASWCQPCAAEASVLEQAQHKLDAAGGTVLGVTYLDNGPDSERFVRQHGVSYPVIRDVSGDFVRSFGATGVPESFVIDRSGRIVALRRFQLDRHWVQTTLSRALATTRASS